MRLVSLAAFACAVISASAFQFPDFVPLHKRQEPGTPAYECHANCGGVITAGRTDGYCNTDDFKTELADCLKCAVEFDIWKYYGGSVSKAATACGLDATPVEASSTTTSVGATTISDTASATKTAEESVNSAVTTDTATPFAGTSAAATSVSSPRVSGSSRPSSLIPSATPTGSSTASTPSKSPAYNGGATINSGNELVFGAFAGCLIASFM
ncbi:unnamed protein product [Penicillium nalgiovense]|uniref:Extracellular membrane protein CFEM domain-containing protein n=1 Tax=Penicillium nalgiovense TaxID=60175 RepID=A0A9W4NDL9_PENNA|nr:unnamed protein product [Penicillium nalgiovense]CAG7949972.1 unnamed protein product [Penicillium nalgiovense]CAG7967153.1 unnamed protein product [Penicillium nalgiovense]CAG7984913.1 unnamed protein product [Penicillium nalgiovense]CAG8000034.1 unnamed protein product [Penicillium nalgiovense]